MSKDIEEMVIMTWNRKMEEMVYILTVKFSIYKRALVYQKFINDGF